jgi:hypothetical protein
LRESENEKVETPEYQNPEVNQDSLSERIHGAQSMIMEERTLGGWIVEAFGSPEHQIPKVSWDRSSPRRAHGDRSLNLGESTLGKCEEEDFEITKS